MALVIGLGAFGAHGLKSMVSASNLAIFKTGVQYHFYHALAILWYVSWRKNEEMSRAVLWSFVLGIILFSGSLYLLSIRELFSFSISWVGPLTPVGGLTFMIGWLLIIYEVVKKSK